MHVQRNSRFSPSSCVLHGLCGIGCFVSLTMKENCVPNPIALFVSHDASLHQGVDGEPALKRNFRHFSLLSDHEGWTLEEFVRSSWQVVLHHFDDHNLCRSWCKHCDAPVDDGAKKGRENHFCKKDSALFGSCVKKKFESMALLSKKMQQCSWRSLSCKTNQALNHAKIMFDPEDKIFSMTLQWQHWANFTLILDA